MSENLLSRETSPYLLQHAENPVHWRPWGHEALHTAGVEQQPILLSVGYAACHWCHVMAHESFEDQAIASSMNDLFINIKVDREERPDVDQIYMDALVRLTGHGGWQVFVQTLGEENEFGNLRKSLSMIQAEEDCGNGGSTSLNRILASMEPPVAW